MPSITFQLGESPVSGTCDCDCGFVPGDRSFAKRAPCGAKQKLLQLMPQPLQIVSAKLSLFPP